MQGGTLINFPTTRTLFGSPVYQIMINFQIYYPENSQFSRVGTIFVYVFIDKPAKRSRNIIVLQFLNNTSLLFLEKVVMIVHLHTQNLPSSSRLFRPRNLSIFRNVDHSSSPSIQTPSYLDSQIASESYVKLPNFYCDLINMKVIFETNLSCQSIICFNFLDVLLIFSAVFSQWG